ncbi:MAG: aminotransferase class IV [Phycisphaerae bacterium]
MIESVCINGEPVRPAEARVSVFDAGFMQGIGLFETLRTYRRRVFRLDHHLRRLIASATALGWANVPRIDVLRENVEQVVDAAPGDDDLRVRLTVTTGAVRPTDADTPPLTIVASATGEVRYPAECYTKGVTVTLCPYRQNRDDPTAGHKTTSYYARLAALRQAHARSAFESLWFTHSAQLAEGCISTVFVVENERLYTPPLDTPVLPGVTRAAVIEVAERAGVAVAERTMSPEDVRSADEVFVTSSVMQLVPVVRIERERVGDETPGDITRALAEEYHRLVREECGLG